MSITVKISQSLFSRIEQVKTKSNGILYGLTQNNATIVLSFSLNNSIETHLPFGFKELGRIEWLNGTGDSEIAQANATNLVHFQYVLGSSSLNIFNRGKSKELEESSYELFEESELFREWICLRTKFTLKYTIESGYQEQLLSNLKATRTKLCETNKPIFKIDGTDIILKKDKGLVGIGKNAKVSAAILQAKKQQTDAVPSKFDVLNIVLAPGDDDANVDDVSSLFANVSLSDAGTRTKIDFESLALVRSSMSANQLHDVILKSIDRNISIVEAAVTNSERALSTFVFYPKVLGHFIIFVYPTSSSDDDPDQIAQRKQNHINLNLSRPCLRRDDVYSFDTEIAGTHLINPHIGLKSLVKNGKQYIVKGEYAYHHYMQDNFNDNGWGCAYRSFQTVFSWYRLQGYTNKPVPTHAEIQKCLIDLGDKPKTFQDSRQWIGSMEVSMCLQYFLNVDSRIVHVRSGSEMAQHGPTFAQHFTTYGTPVMIGGGVLAHTILGVDFNGETNELRFLVLDPHYTGEDDLDVVQKKGWCSWKPVTFWDKKSYYNCCMPMFPDANDY